MSTDWDGLTPDQIDSIEALDAAEEAEADASSAAAVHTEPKSNTVLQDEDASQFKIASTPAEAGCYAFIAEVFEVDESQPALTREIRQLADPRYVPLICKRAYKTPAGTEIVKTYFCIGKHIMFPGDGYRDAAIKLAYVPRGFPFPPDEIHCLRILWAPWDTKDEEGRAHHPVEYANAMPPETVPIGRWLLDQMLALKKFFDTGIDLDHGGDIETTAAKVAKIVMAETEADNRRMEAARAEARLRMRDNWPQLKDAIDNERWSPEPEAHPLFLDLKKA